MPLPQSSAGCSPQSETVEARPGVGPIRRTPDPVRLAALSTNDCRRWRPGPHRWIDRPVDLGIAKP